MILCGSSSVGRAAAFQAAGRGFEPRLPLVFEFQIQDFKFKIEGGIWKF